MQLINCENKNLRSWTSFENFEKLGAPNFQEAPTLTELNTRDAIRRQNFPKVEDSFSISADIRDQIIQTDDTELHRCYVKALHGERLTAAEGLKLLVDGDMMTLGFLATKAKERFHPERTATFLIDRNINYTNVCRIGCDFCAFYRKEGDHDAYTHPKEEIFKKIEETIALNGTGVLMQGGVNIRLKIDYFEDLFRSIKQRYKIHLHALSVIEIENIAQVSRLSLEETLERLKRAGLDSIPGAGAEILVDEIRLNQSPVKRHAKRWIETMKAAHRADLTTTATMMFGALEGPEHVIEHIAKIREAQDETHGFYAFILWTFQGQNTDLAKKNPEVLEPTDAITYLKTLAVSRLMMDNIPNIQGSWVTMGPKIGQISLHYGANDVGSIMIEENVVSAAGTAFTLTEQSMIELIRHAGFIPQQRDTYYNILKRY